MVMMTIGLLLKIQPMIPLRIFLRISSYDMSSKGSCSFETYESYKEEQSEFLYDQSELYLRIGNNDLKK